MHSQRIFGICRHWKSIGECLNEGSNAFCEFVTTLNGHTKMTVDGDLFLRDLFGFLKN